MIFFNLTLCLSIAMPFNWHVYLSETGAEISPSSLFEHVSRSFQPIIRKGCVLEALVVNSNELSDPSNENKNKWWPAEVVLISGYLVLFKWCMPNRPGNSHHPVAFNKTTEKMTVPNVSSDRFWFDIKGSDWKSVRPLGCSLQNRASWARPKVYSVLDTPLSFEEETKWVNELRVRAVPDVFFEQRALYHYETIRVGGYFECEHANNPRFVWPVQVLMNVGGRVKLMWFGSSSINSQEKCSTVEVPVFTLFYLHRRIHPLGWANAHGFTYRPPPGITLKRSISNVGTFVRGALSAFSCPLISDPDVDPHRPPLHEFKEGWKLEAVNPMKPYLIQPATIAQVFDSRYFLVQLDDLRAGSALDRQQNGQSALTDRINQVNQFVAYAGSAKIMPVNTSQLRGLYLAPPPGWPTNRPFTWTNYLTFLSTNPHCSPASNGLLRAASTSSLISTVQPLGSETRPTDDVCITSNSKSAVVQSTTNHLVDDTPLSSGSVPFCPSESMFRGTTRLSVITDIGCFRSSSVPTDHSPSNLSHVPTVPHDLDIDSSTAHATSRLPTTDASGPDRFLLGMKLEMVLPCYVRTLYKITHGIGPPLCACTVTRVYGAHLLWVLPDLDVSIFVPTESTRPIMVDARSTQLYPVGWAAFVGHPIIPPVGYEQCGIDAEDGLPLRPQTPKPVVKPREDDVSDHIGALWNVGLRLTHSLQYQTIAYEAEEICPPIYINTKCYLGPFLCKTSLELLPRRFGPGPTIRVMHYLLTRLVSAAYKPVRVLRMFEADWASGMASACASFLNQQSRDPDCDFPTACRPRTGGSSAAAVFDQAESEMLEQRRSAMCVVLLRIRCPRRGVKIEAPVEVCCRSRAVEEFCRQVSLVLEACPHLISLTPPDLSAVPATSNSTSDLLSSASVPKRSRDNRTLVRRDLCFGSLMLSPTVGDCPSFCAVRLRSRTLDRLPGWKRRMFASLRPFGVRSSVHIHASRGIDTSTTVLRTRAAVAAAQRQPSENNSSEDTPSQQPATRDSSGLINGITARKNRSRVAGRFRGTARRVQSRVLYGTKFSMSAISATGTNKHIHDATTGPYGDANTPDPNGSQTNTCGNPTFPGTFHSWSNHIPSLNGFTNSESPTTVVPDVELPPDCSILHPPICDPHLSEHTLCSILADAPRVTLSSNPLFWSPVELASYLGETDCREMWPWLAAEAVDGQAFMLLTLPVLHQLVGLRWEDAIRLARHVVSVKRAFMEQFGTEFSDRSTSCSTPS
ncbi:Scm protein containing 4 mbt domains (Sfmbt) [Fasciola gigantica]|uniref:Scm protein containing 4 mbt domains (Sfmbt) n=1 Tax=Fasciola gigantica TaxID=46835 RepID=A0A504YRA5_FASGI|nr:Scm protein containing 4 mbt domains (Sfmbt) [Fasciola gigantica]